MKKFLALLLVVAFCCFGAVGCSGDDTTKSDGDTTTKKEGE